MISLHIFILDNHLREMSTLYTTTINTTTGHPKELVGCDAAMIWCNYTPRLPLPVYLAAYPLLSIGFPMCNVSISTLFAKVLGPRRQGFMQSMMIMSGSLARTLGPIIIRYIIFIKYWIRMF